MTRIEIENQLMNEIHYLPIDVMEAMLKLALSIKNIPVADKTNHTIESAWKKEIAERVKDEDKLTVLRSALITGENSGAVENYSLANLLDELKAINKIEPLQMDEINRADRVNTCLDDV